MSSDTTSPDPDAPEPARAPPSSKRRRWAIWGGGAVTAILALALIAPLFFDFNDLKPQIQDAAQKATGRVLAIDGDIGVRILPMPALTVEGIRFANPPGAAEPDMVRLRRLDVRIALLPLLAGKVEVASVRLDQPVIRLEKFADGRANWQFDAPMSDPAAGGAPVEADTSPGLPISVRGVVIDEGTLVYVDHGTGSVIELNEIDLDIDARTLKGPFDADIEAVYRGIPIAVQAESGALVDGDDIPVSVRLSVAGRAAVFRLDGTLSAPSLDGAVNGAVSLTVKNVADLAALGLAAGEHRLPGALDNALDIDARLSGSVGQLAIDDLAIKTRGVALTGRVDLLVGDATRADIRLGADKIDLDAFLAADAVTVDGRGPAPLPPAPQAEGKAGPAAGVGASEPPFEIPADLAGSAEITVKALTYRGEGIADLRVAANLGDGRLHLAEFSAGLPGNASIVLDGTVYPDAGRLTAGGTARFAAADLRHLLTWVGADLSAVPADALARLDYQSTLRVTSDRIEVSDIRLTLDETRASGGIVLAPGERPGLGVALQIGRLDLDRYMPGTAPAPAAQRLSPGDARSPAPSTGDDKPATAPDLSALAILDTFDLNLRLSAAAVIANRIPFQGIDVDLSLIGGALDLRRLRIDDLAGARADIALRATDLSTRPKIDTRYDVAVADFGRTLETIDIAAPDAVMSLGAVTLTGTAKGTPEKLRLETALGFGGGRVSFTGDVSPFGQALGIDLVTTVDHGEASSLFRAFKPDYRAAGGTLGPLSLSALVRVDPHSAQVSDLKGRIGAVAVNGEASAALDGERPAVIVRVATSEIPLDAFMPADRAGAGQGRDVRTQKGAGAKTGASQSGAPSGGAASGGAPWSQEPLDLAWMGGFDADVNLAAAAIKYKAVRVTKPAVVLAVKDGVATLSRLGGDLFGGTINLTGRVDSRGVPGFATNLKVQGAEMSEALRSAGSLDLAAGRLDLDLALTSQGGSQAAMVSALNGTGVYKVTNGRFNGFDLDRVVAGLDGLNSPAAFLTLFQTGLSGGSTPFREFQGTFNINNGVIHSNDLKMTTGVAVANGGGAVDLGKYQMNVGVEFVITKKPNLPPFGMRITGPINNPKRSLDLAALQSFYFQKGVNKLLDKVLPGRDAGAAAPADGQAAPPTKPREVIQDLFKGLGR